MHNSFKFLETNSKAMEIVSATGTVKWTPLTPRTDKITQPYCVISGSSRSKQDFIGISLLHEGLTWT
jgi:hypothetical protein